VNESDSVFSRLRSRSEEVLTQLSAELMSNPQFARAVQQALKGKQLLDDAAARALEKANIPSRKEFRQAQRRLESLTEELRELRGRLDALEKRARAGRSSRSTRPATAGKKPKKKTA